MDIIEQIKKGEIDCNNQSLYFSILIKGLLLELNKEIKIRNIPIPHIILHTGDDIMYLKNKGYDHSKEPEENTNEDYIYNIVPRCIVNPKGINIPLEQLSSPYSRGIFTIEDQDNIYNISAEFRRLPIKLSVDLKYYVNSYTEMLELMQQIISKLSFIRTYNITYMGQVIKCSYNIPDSLDNEYQMEMDGLNTENRNKTMEFSIEIESNFPVFDNKTVVSTGNIITNCNRDLNPGISTAYVIQSSKEGVIYHKKNINI